MGSSGLYLRIGLLIVGGGALFVALIWFLGGVQFSHGILFESYFSESVQGLEVGAAVKYRGVTLGRVTEIGLVTAEYGDGQAANAEIKTYQLVFVRCIVDADKLGRVPTTEQAVADGLRARLASQGLTGLSYIELDFVNPNDYPALKVPWTPKVSYIPSMPSTFAHLQDQAQQLLSKLNSVDVDKLTSDFDKLTSEYTGLAADLRANLSDGDIHHVLAEASETLRTARDAIREADLPGVASEVRQTSTSLRDLLQSHDTRALLANAALAAERLANAADKLGPLLASIQIASRRADNSIADVEQSLTPLLRDIQATTANLREVSEALRGSPAQTLFGSPPPRAREPAK